MCTQKEQKQWKIFLKNIYLISNSIEPYSKMKNQQKKNKKKKIRSHKKVI